MALLVLGFALPSVARPTAAPRADSTIGAQKFAAAIHDDAIPTARDPYAVTSRAELLRQRFTLTYSTTWTGPVRWPFPGTVPISDGYGWRQAPCPGCSTWHTAVDFAPGAGVPIYAVADGVVVGRDDGRGSWGNYVVLEHVIDGRTVRSSYAHMQRGTSPLAAGDTVAVGDYVGLVGATGQVTGAHLHLEIEVDGTAVDPFVWLTENAG